MIHTNLGIQDFSWTDAASVGRAGAGWAFRHCAFTRCSSFFDKVVGVQSFSFGLQTPVECQAQKT